MFRTLPNREIKGSLSCLTLLSKLSSSISNKEVRPDLVFWMASLNNASSFVKLSKLVEMLPIVFPLYRVSLDSRLFMSPETFLLAAVTAPRILLSLLWQSYPQGVSGLLGSGGPVSGFLPTNSLRVPLDLNSYPGSSKSSVLVFTSFHNSKSVNQLTHFPVLLSMHSCRAPLHAWMAVWSSRDSQNFST